jgi:hypothetical protein
MYRISVDTSLLNEQSKKILDSSHHIDSAGKDLLSAVQGIRSSRSQLMADAQRDALSIRTDPVLGLNPRAIRLNDLGRALAKIAGDFEEVDERHIKGFRLVPLISPCLEFMEFWVHVRENYPDIVLYDFPQTRMVTCGSVVIHVGDPENQSGNIWVTNGKFIHNIIGTYTDKNGKEYYVVFLGFDENNNPILGYVEVSYYVSDPVDYSSIPICKGTFRDGQTGDSSSLKSPWGRGDWPIIYLLKNPICQKGDPKQNLILGPSGLGFEGLGNTPKNNLCGELAVMAAVGEQDLRNGFGKFIGLGDKYLNILQNDDQTGPEALIPLFNAYGYDAKLVPDGKMLTPSELSKGIDDGKKYVILVDLDTNSGMVSTMDNTSGHHAGHWVTVTGVYQDNQGNVWVDVYNPYTNQVERYSWETICASSKNPGPSNSGGPVIIEATPRNPLENGLRGFSQ